MSNIGENIRKRREALGMSQDELAEKMGYKSRSTIAKIEKGVNDVTQNNIVKFANVLRTTPAYLMGWEEMQKKNDTLTGIAARMRTDEEFAEILKGLNQLDSVQLASVKQVVAAFLSKKG